MLDDIQPADIPHARAAGDFRPMGEFERDDGSDAGIAADGLAYRLAGKPAPTVARGW